MNNMSGSFNNESVQWVTHIFHIFQIFILKFFYSNLFHILLAKLITRRAILFNAISLNNFLAYYFEQNVHVILKYLDTVDTLIYILKLFKL